MTLRYLVVDDHALFRDGMISLLKAAGKNVVGEAVNGQEAVALVEKLRPDVVLMDIDMPVMNGIEATRQIALASPQTQVIMLTIAQEEAKLFDALRAGAKGYLLKSLNTDEFIKLLNGIDRGEPPIPPSLTAKLIDYVAGNTRESVPVDASLTEREVELLRYLGQGLPNKAIAEALRVSENTVKYHIKNILQKLDLSNRSEAAAYAVRHNLSVK